MDHRIKYYPVGNGDTSLISLSDNTKIIIDLNVTVDSEDDSDESRYDVKEDLLSELNTDGDIPFTDVHVLTHPDNDHCRGFEKTFYTGDPHDYSDTHLEEGLIRIDELWFSPRIFTEYQKDLSDDAKAFRKEAERRIDLHKSDNSKKDEPGNRIKIIGYSNDSELNGLEQLIVIPGNIIDIINGSQKSDFSFFVHAPFRDDTDNNEERNDTSVVMQAKFDVLDTQNAGLAMFGGDAGALIWEKIYEKSDDEDLEFDLFLAPHHCSWKFFNTTSHSDGSEPVESSTTILDKHREGATVISSSRPFESYDDDLPPHLKARKYYKETVSGGFLVTSEEPSKDKPLPIEFRITLNGPQRIDSKSSSSASKSGLVTAAVGKPKTYGRKSV